MGAKFHELNLAPELNFVVFNFMTLQQLMIAKKFLSGHPF